jgi:hypothetical protein
MLLTVVITDISYRLTKHKSIHPINVLSTCKKSAGNLSTSNEKVRSFGSCALCRRLVAFAARAIFLTVGSAATGAIGSTISIKTRSAIAVADVYLSQRAFFFTLNSSQYIYIYVYIYI